MFEYVDYAEFQNKVPKYWRAMSSKCTPFNLKIPVETRWAKSEKRVLIVVGHVTSEDLSIGKLLGGNSNTVLENCFKYAKKMAQPYGYMEDNSTAYAAINFNFFKSYHLGNKERADADRDSATRVRAYIAEIDPTHIITLGEETSASLFGQDVEYLLNKKGWIHRIKVEGKKRFVMNSIDFGDAVVGAKNRGLDDSPDNGDDALKAAYTLGYLSRNIRNLLLGKNPHTLGDIKVKPFLVDTIEKFKGMMADLNSADKIAFDTETANLNKIANKLLILQFSTVKELGYVLPYHHKDSPFNKTELEYIRKKLRKFFMKKKEMSLDSYLITYNGKFDLTQIKEQLGIPFIYWPVYDAMVGEHTHDETLRFLENQSNTPHGGMGQICTNYGNAFYFEANFSKKDRGNMEATDLYDPDFQRYCAADTQLLLGLHDEQISRAKHTIHREDGKPVSYKKDFRRIVVSQMSNNIHVFAGMEQRGVHMDAKYVSYMKTRESPISQAITDHIYSFNNMEAVKKANQSLLEDEGEMQEGGLFDVTPWVFSIGKPAHKEKLVFDVLGLQALAYGKKGTPKLDKKFKRAYAEVPEIERLNDLEKLKKLKSSYVDAFARQLNEADGKTDRHLRPSYGFFKVLSGRSNSEKPSLQQVPQHSANAKYIKRMFAPERGRLIVKMDYSAHEVRGWSIISHDELLGELFAIGRRIRQSYRATGKKKYALELQLKGDVHKLNVEFFFGTPIHLVTKEERNAIKGVVFGAIYGMSYKTLAKDLKKEDSFTKDLYERFFARFKQAAAWLDWAKVFGRKNLFVKSCIGRRRHLFGHLTGDSGVANAMDRRAMNSPIQGLGADFGHTGARLTEISIYEYLLKVGEITEDATHCPVGTEIMVHDSLFSSAPFNHILAVAQIMQWTTTIGVQRYYDKHFDLTFTVPVEIEMEFGASQDMTYKWDWSHSGYDPQIHEWNEASLYYYGYNIKSFNQETGEFKVKRDGVVLKGTRIKEGFFSLEEAIRLSLIDHAAIYTDLDWKKEYKKIFANWESSKTKKYLDTHYPILPDYTPEEKQAA